MIKQMLVHNEYLQGAVLERVPTPPEHEAPGGVGSAGALRRCYFSDLMSFSCSLQTCLAPSRAASYGTGTSPRPPLSAAPEGERKFIRAPGLLAPRGAGTRTEILGNPIRLTRGAPPTLGKEGKLKSIICPGIRKQHLCASWLGGSKGQQGKHGMGLLPLQ